MFRAYSEAGGLTPHEEMAPALALLQRRKACVSERRQPEQGRKAIADVLPAV